AFLELVVVLVGLEKGLLDQIFGVLGAAGHPIGRVVERVHERHRLRVEIPGRDRLRLRSARLGELLHAHSFHALVFSQNSCRPAHAAPAAGRTGLTSAFSTEYVPCPSSLTPANTSRRGPKFLRREPECRRKGTK